MAIEARLCSIHHFIIQWAARIMHAAHFLYISLRLIYRIITVHICTLTTFLSPTAAVQFFKIKTLKGDNHLT
jgi:hypothetical protein